MKSSTIFYGILVIALAGLVIAVGNSWLFSDSQPIDLAELDSGRSRLASEEPRLPFAGNEERPGESLPQRTRSINSPSQSSASRLVQIDDELNYPDSAEAVAWQNEHFYPSLDVFEEASSSFLKAADLNHRSPITPIDLVRAELYASAFPESPGNSVHYLERAAAMGSIYALEALSRVHAPTDRKGNLILSQAYLRAAELRGNWALGTVRPDLGRETNLVVDLYAQMLLREINSHRASLGMWPLEQDLAPGLDEFLEALTSYLGGNADPGD